MAYGRKLMRMDMEIYVSSSIDYIASVTIRNRNGSTTTAEVEIVDGFYTRNFSQIPKWLLRDIAKYLWLNRRSVKLYECNRDAEKRYEGLRYAEPEWFWGVMSKRANSDMFRRELYGEWNEPR